MAVQFIESFSWVDNSGPGLAALATRYNAVFGGLAIVAGRFAGNAINLSASNAFNFPKGTFGPDIVVGAATFFSGAPVGTANIIYQVFENNSAGAEVFSLRFNAAGQVNGQRAGTILATGTKVLQANTWYYLEIEVHVDPAAGSFKCWIDGVLEFSVAGVNTRNSATAVMGAILLGQTQTQKWCDWYVKSTLVPFGPQRVDLIKPASDGANLAWTPSGGGTHFNMVNEVPPDSDTTFNSTNVAANKDSYNFSALPFAPATINAVQVSLFARFDDGGPHSIATLVRSGGANFVGATQAITGTYLDLYLQVYETDPNTAAAWTSAGLAAAQFGMDLVL